MVERCARELTELDDGLRRPRHRRRLRAPPRARPAAARRARGSSRSSAARSATSRRARGAASCAASPAAAAGRRPPAARHRPRQGHAHARGRLQRRRGRHGGVQPQRAARDQPRARRRLRRSSCSSTSRSSTPSASGSRCACARRCASRCAIPAVGLEVESPRARSCARRSARSSRASAWSRPRRGRARLERVLTDDAGLFALSLSTPRG